MLPKGSCRSLTGESPLIAGFEDFFKFDFHGLSEHEGVEGAELSGQPDFGFPGDVRGFHNPLVRGFGFVVAFAGFGADAFFFQQLHRGAEEVVEEPPLGAIQFVEQGHEARVVKAFVAEPLAEMGPVFLFDVGVVVFSVGTASGEQNGLGTFGEVAVQVMVQKLAAVIAVEAQDGKGEVLLDVLELLQDALFAAPPDGSLFGPAGGDIDAVEAVDELAGHGGAAVGDGVRLQEARARLIPLVGA